MEKRFEAKHIKGALGIDQRRLQYITDKMRIDPDIEPAGGTGRAHAYSLTNFLEIAIAHRLSSMGLNPAAVRFTLDHINKVDEKYRIGIYDPKVGYLNYRLNIMNEVTPPLLHFDGEGPEHIQKELRKRVTPFENVWGLDYELLGDEEIPNPEEYERTMLQEKINSFNDKISYMGEPEILEMNPGEYYGQQDSAEEDFYLFFEGYMTLNLEAIRSRVFQYASR